jgi:hypothetical protein
MRPSVRVLVTGVAAVAASTACLPVLPSPAEAGRRPADLVTVGVSAAVVDGQLRVTATVKNKGHRKARATRTAFRLSTDTQPSGTDPLLGTAGLGALEPKKTRKSSGAFDLGTVPVGTYHLVACADSRLKVVERRDTNNCRASDAAVQVGAGGTVTVVATAGIGGTVTASGVSGGTCSGTACTFSLGTGKVTFTPVPSAGYRFGAWTGATCTGQTAGSGGAITFTNPTSATSCAASFVKQVTIAWSVSGGIAPPLEGSVTATATGGSCTANGASGTCTVDAGASTVTLTASPGIPAVFAFDSWGAAPSSTCAGTTSGTDSEVKTFTDPTADQSCEAAYTLIL